MAWGLGHEGQYRVMEHLCLHPSLQLALGEALYGTHLSVPRTAVRRYDPSTLPHRVFLFPGSSCFGMRERRKLFRDEQLKQKAGLCGECEELMLPLSPVPFLAFACFGGWGQMSAVRLR